MINLDKPLIISMDHNHRIVPVVIGQVGKLPGELLKRSIQLVLSMPYLREGSLRPLLPSMSSVSSKDIAKEWCIKYIMLPQ